MAFDFKKEYKEYYMPPKKPVIVDVPEMNYIAVRGKGDPNEKDGEYKQAVGVLYAVAYTLKMSYKTDHSIEGFYEYVVPPLEGLWKQDSSDSIDYSRKDGFQWVAMIRLPEFVTEEEFRWAVETAEKKNKTDCSKARFMTLKEGLCVQMMHIGSYDDEPESVALMNEFIAEQGYVNDMGNERQHHEIYLSDPRKTEPAKLKTVIRHPIKKG